MLGTPCFAPGPKDQMRCRKSGDIAGTASTDALSECFARMHRPIVSCRNPLNDDMLKFDDDSSRNDRTHARSNPTHAHRHSHNAPAGPDGRAARNRPGIAPAQPGRYAMGVAGSTGHRSRRAVEPTAKRRSAGLRRGDGHPQRRRGEGLRNSSRHAAQEPARAHPHRGRGASHRRIRQRPALRGDHRHRSRHEAVAAHGRIHCGAR